MGSSTRSRGTDEFAKTSGYIPCQNEVSVLHYYFHFSIVITHVGMPLRYKVFPLKWSFSTIGNTPYCPVHNFISQPLEDTKCPDAAFMCVGAYTATRKSVERGVEVNVGNVHV